MKIALALICKGSDEEAKMLDNCLGFNAKFFDDVFVTITHRVGEERNKAVEAVCKKHEVVISDFEWCNDFSKARNYNFAQVPKAFEFIMWCDADDGFRGLEQLRTIVKDNMDIDAFSMNYLYFFDEYKQPIVVHHKTQIIKNDGCVEWAGALHEDFKENRDTKRKFIKPIERIHLTTETRVNENKKRNIEVSKAELDRKPTDPRAMWNFANSLFGDEQYLAAKTIFENFLNNSNSDEEKYLVLVKLASISESLNEKNLAIDFCRRAIGLKPSYPDAYHLLGQIYYGMNKFAQASEMILTGLQNKPPYYSIIVYNPRDYDFHPMMLLAKTFYQMSRPDNALTCLESCKKMQPKNQKVLDMIKAMKKEKKFFDKMLIAVEKLEKLEGDKFQKLYDKLDDDIKANPGICALRNTKLIKKESSGKDLVIYAGYTSLPWSPSYAKKKGVGGSEEAVLNLSEEWKKLGWNVTVYNNCELGEVSASGVVYKPFWMWNYRDKQDVTIFWRTPKVCDYNVNSTKIFIDLHDVISPGEFTPTRLAKIDKVFVKTQFHRNLFPNIPDEKIVVIPNGMNFDLFEQKVKKDQYLLVNTSSPDRSMDVLPKLFKMVKEQVPEARCKWAYGFDVFDTVHSEHSMMMKWKDETIKAMEDAGIENMGRLSQKDCAKLYLEANILAYPTEFAEIDCITVKKAQGCGALPVTTDFGALEESVQYGSKIHSNKTNDTWCMPNQFHFGLQDEKAQQEWVDAVVKILKIPMSDRQEMKDWTQKFSWDKIAKQWNQIMK